MTRIEQALLAVLGLAFAFLLVVILHGCDLDSHVAPPDHYKIIPSECGCYASLVVTEDGGVCEEPGATCPRVCTCVQDTMKLCAEPMRPYRGFVCLAGADEDGG